jgi:hypothetical protein
MVFNMNIMFMVLPLAIRLKHRPCFLAFVYSAIIAILKSYPSVSSFFCHFHDIRDKFCPISAKAYNAYLFVRSLVFPSHIYL